MTLVRVLETRYDYPPIEGTDRPRRAAAGDIIHVTEQQAGELISEVKVSPDLNALLRLFETRDEKSGRNRANLAAHIAYTRRKVKPCQPKKSATQKL